MVWPLDYYPLLLFHVSSDEAATHSPKAVKRHFRALGRLVRGSGVHVIFSSLLPVAGSKVGRNRWIRSIMWRHGWCYGHSFGFFDNGMGYTAPGLRVSDGIHLSLRGKRVFAHKLAGLIDRALN